MMRNQLALSGEKILEKIYPQLFHHVGMIRGEYLLRELNKIYYYKVVSNL